MDRQLNIRSVRQRAQINKTQQQVVVVKMNTEEGRSMFSRRDELLPARYLRMALRADLGGCKHTRATPLADRAPIDTQRGDDAKRSEKEPQEKAQQTSFAPLRGEHRRIRAKCPQEEQVLHKPNYHFLPPAHILADSTAGK